MVDRFQILQPLLAEMEAEDRLRALEEAVAVEAAFSSGARSPVSQVIALRSFYTVSVARNAAGSDKYVAARRGRR